MLNTVFRLCGVLCLWGLAAPAHAADAAAADSPQQPWWFHGVPAAVALPPAANTGTDGPQLRPIDEYIARQLAAHDLMPAPRAAPHRQVRRLSLMLTGLPPDPDVVRRFVDEPTDARYQALVDHYLDSPQFGERWARHWMDVVRYAETWGYEWNHLIRGAWRYRDYLIRAFNQDVPYDQFVREHIAGDLLEQPRINEELGINESLIGGAFYRFGETGHDDCVLYPDISLDVMDNQIDTLSKAFQALTVSCSRCHDHKLDQIPQHDYYALLGIMASSRQVIRTLDLPNRQTELRERLHAAKLEIRSELANVWRQEAERLSPELLEQFGHEAPDKNAEDAKTTGPAHDMEHPLFAWQSSAAIADDPAWPQVWATTRAAVRGEHQRRITFNRDNYELFGDFSQPPTEQSQWSVEGLSAADAGGFVAAGDFSVLPAGDSVIHGLFPAGFYSHALSQKLNAALRSPLLPEGRKFVSYQAVGERDSVCRTVIANCTLPYFHSNRFDTPGLKWSTVDLQHIRTSPLVHLKSYLEWSTALDDQGFPVLQTPNSDYIAMLEDPRSYFGVTKVYLHDVGQPPLQELDGPLQIFATDVDNRVELAARYRQILQEAINRWAEGQATEADVYWLNSFLDLTLLSRKQTASAALAERVGAFRMLEKQLETPRRIVGMADQGDGFDAPLLIGGDATSPEGPVERKYLELIEPWIDSPTQRTGSGRRRMAELIANEDNPLTARVMANRIWHYLMGRGIVSSVDNFGNLGDRPSHPELLDYLARRFIDSGWSTKTVVREIVLSDAFRQSSAEATAAGEQDPENRLFHRYVSRRLEAEVIRDSILSVSGRLDQTMYGPSIDPFRQEEIDTRRLYAGPLDGAGRRSIYLKVTRMGPSKLLELFNFPDPSVTRGRRDSTNVPSQALGLLNHPFVHQQADVNAQRLLRTSTGEPAFEPMLKRLFWTCLCRPPDAGERRHYVQFFGVLAAAHGCDSVEAACRDARVWKDLIHAIYNLKEFTYVL